MRVGIGGGRTGVAGWLGGEALKEFRRTVALGLWGGEARGVGPAAESLGHAHWSITHRQTRAISVSW